MSQIILDQDQMELLDSLEYAPEVRDPSGHLLGYLVSPAKFSRMMEGWEIWEEVHIAELDRRAEEGGGCTLDEIWKELGVVR